MGWISVKNRLPKADNYKSYLVTVAYDGEGNFMGRKTMVMRYAEYGRKHEPVWMMPAGSKSIWEVLFWQELPGPCIDEV